MDEPTKDRLLTDPLNPPLPSSQISPQKTRRHLKEVSLLFLRLGFTAFGGPAAHIAMFRDEVITRRQWITDEHFLDMLGATNLIPGPNSTEMAIHLGYVRAGWRGLIVAGLCFILPAALVVLSLAVLYVEYGTTPAAEWLLYGIKPVIIAVVAQAMWGLSKTAVKSRLLGVIGAAVFFLYLMGLNELLLLFGGGLLFMLVKNAVRLRNVLGQSGLSGLATLGLPGALLVPTAASAAATSVSMSTLFFTFLKIGSVLYGSGYVLLAFLRNDFVERLGWLSNQQLLDAVAVGQFTPGPVFTTATFIGYVMGGFPGALLATIGIFLPSFVFVLATNPLIPRLRRSAWLSGLLDGINVAALGLMAAVTLELGMSAIRDGITAAVAGISAVLLIRFKVNSTWLILGGGLVGLFGFLLH